MRRVFSQKEVSVVR